MPLDLTPIIAGAVERLRLEAGRMAAIMGVLGPWLADRLRQVTTLEARTRAFPVFAFEGTALSVRVSAAQNGVLRPYSSTGAAIAAPFVAFGRGFTRIGQAVEDELILPNLLGAVAGIVVVIRDSVARHARPTAATFDPNRARASDIFGLLGLTYRALTESTGQLRQLVTNVGAAYRIFAPAPGSAGGAGAAGSGGDASAAAGPGPLPRPLIEGIDEAGRYVVAALMLIPAIPGWIGVLARAAWLRGRVFILDTLEGIERSLFAVRRQVYELFFNELPRRLRDLPALVAVLGSLVQVNIQYFAFYARLYFEQLISSLTGFLDDLRNYLNYFIDIVNTVLAIIDAILDFDILDLIKPFLGLAGPVLDLLNIRFTINDLLDAAGTAVNFALYASLKAAIGAAKAAVIAADRLAPPLIQRSLPMSSALRKLRLLERVVDAFFQSFPYPTETAKPRIPRMPNMFDLLIGRPPEEVGRAFATWGARAAGDVAAVINTGAIAFDEFGIAFSRAAADAARTGPANQLPEFGRQSAELANSLYADQVHELGERIRDRTRRPSLFVRGFEEWVAGGGFHVIGRTIPLYVEEMRRYWREQTEAGEGPYVEITPTSPHIIARRARLGRVRTRRVSVRLGRRRLDEALVREAAGQFQRAVQDAYATGNRRLRAHAETVEL